MCANYAYYLIIILYWFMPFRIANGLIICDEDAHVFHF